jgi:hypothetical protein
VGAGKSCSEGFELEVAGEVLPGWQVSGGYTCTTTWRCPARRILKRPICATLVIHPSHGVTGMRKLWIRYLYLLEHDLSTQIFDNLKNLLVCALLFAAGTSTLGMRHELFLGVLVYDAAGWGLIVMSGLLLILNVSDGIRRLARLRYHVLIQALVCITYLIIAGRVVEMVWAFRAD